MQQITFTGGRIAARGELIPAVIVQDGTAGDNDTAAGTLSQSIIGFWYDETPYGLQVAM